jgi:hypothetical protein
MQQDDCLVLQPRLLRLLAAVAEEPDLPISNAPLVIKLKKDSAETMKLAQVLPGRYPVE